MYIFEMISSERAIVIDGLVQQLVVVARPLFDSECVLVNVGVSSRNECTL